MSTEAIQRGRDYATAADRHVRAQTAVKAFRKMQHGLTSYARAITGDKKVRVQIDGGPPRTDGKIIYYRPPLALGDNLRHDRAVCDKRDPETRLLICAACKVHEEVLVNIYHEIAHLAFGTFAKTTERAKVDAIAHAVREHGGTEEAIRKRIESAPVHMIDSYLGLSGLISPYLPNLFNCLEDARVDSSMFEARKGTRKMLEADTFSLFRDGIPMPDGTFKTWLEAPLNGQIAIACYLQGAGYVEWEKYLHPQIAVHMADPDVRALVTRAADVKSASEVYNLSFPPACQAARAGLLQAPRGGAAVGTRARGARRE